MGPAPVITFTTDFGTGDTFVGQMKGVALGICPDARLVDLTHEVPPQDIAAGAYHLWTAFRAFPDGTVHVAVVDPGVGTDRAAVAVRAGGAVFVGPDNGIFSRVLDEVEPEAAHRIVETRFSRSERSATFEGRDVFAPAAAWIAAGTPITELGPTVPALVRLPPPPDLVPGRSIEIRVLAVDRFGNAVLDVSPRSARGAERLRVRLAGGPPLTFHRTYADAPPETPFLLRNSSGLIEIALRGGSAADRLGLAPGDVVRAIVEPPHVL